MFEDKDQGHKRKCSKKKTSPKFFFKQSSKKRSSKIFFRRSPKKNGLDKNLKLIYKILTIQKIVLSSSREQGNFRELEASRPRPRTSKCVLEDVFEAKEVLEDSTSDINCKYSCQYRKFLPFSNKRDYL